MPPWGEAQPLLELLSVDLGFRVPPLVPQNYFILEAFDYSVVSGMPSLSLQSGRVRGRFGGEATMGEPMGEEGSATSREELSLLSGFFGALQGFRVLSLGFKVSFLAPFSVCMFGLLTGTAP